MDRTAECEALLARMCDWLNGSGFAGEGHMRLPTAIIRASMAHLYLAWIHPFGDGNGRTLDGGLPGHAGTGILVEKRVPPLPLRRASLAQGSGRNDVVQGGSEDPL